MTTSYNVSLSPLKVKRKKREYLPSQKSGPFALLLTLYRESQVCLCFSNFNTMHTNITSICTDAQITFIFCTESFRLIGYETGIVSI